MAHTDVDIEATERLRETLQTIPTVRRVFTDEDAAAMYVICEPEQGGGEALSTAIATAVESDGFDAEELVVHVATLGGTPLPPRRVRFTEASLARPRMGTSTVRVVLEWSDRNYQGDAEGEGGLPLELRLCAQATVRALGAVLEDRLSFDVVGVKAIRIFDHDFVAVLLHCPQEADRRLIGVALSGGDLPGATARAVLNATNRMLGNYL